MTEQDEISQMKENAALSTIAGPNAADKIWQTLIVGGGPAGLAAAIAAYDAGAKDVLVVERDVELGGILNQCVHNGFGLKRFQEELTGPEYAGRYIDELKKRPIVVALETTALELAKTADENAPIELSVVSPTIGFKRLRAKTVVLATGCRERTRGAIGTPGDRPSGVFTAGAAQRYVNREGERIGKRVVILGSGDIGLIMARRLTLEGAKVLAVVELMPYSNGLTRNLVQCLQDFDIPLYLSHTITRVVGKSRLEKVVVAKVDEKRAPILGTEIEFDCDALLLSVGLIPENEVARTAGVELDPKTNGPVVRQSRETSVPNVYSCGNALHVHDLVDFVSEEAQIAGRAAALRALEGERPSKVLRVKHGDRVNYVAPQLVELDLAPERVSFFMRVSNVFRDKRLVVRNEETGEILKELRRPKVAPAEMERLTLERSALEKVGEGAIVVSLED